MIKRLLPYMGKYKKQALLSPVFVILDIAAEISIPLLMTRIVDIGIENKDLNYILKIGAIMILLGLFAMLLGSTNIYFSSVASQGFGNEIRKTLYAKVQRFSFSNIDRFSTPSLITRINSDTKTLQMSVMMSLRLMIRAPLMITGALIFALSISKQLGSVLLVAVPILAIAIIILMSYAMPLFTLLQEKEDKLNGSVQENLSNIRVVKSFVRSAFEKTKFYKFVQSYTDTSIKAFETMVYIGPIMTIALNATSIAVLWFGGNFVIAGDLFAGELMSFFTYIVQIMMSLMLLSMTIVMITRSKASAKRIVEILDENIDMADKTNLTSAITQGNIEFKNVSFKYDINAQESVLEDISFSAKSGETIAIVGSTGAAKSTLVSLIPRLYDTTSGDVLIDGISVKDYSMHNLRERIAMVLQKNTLFSGTIEENIKWGNPNATLEEVEQVAKIAQAHDFIMSFENGYQTYIERGGANVSGGQRQRLCIARAILKQPKILILDDSTSAVDSTTEEKIRQGLAQYMSHMTVIIIAQRISSVVSADKIIVLDDGKVVDIGHHNDLMDRCTIYQEIYKSQLEGGQQ